MTIIDGAYYRWQLIVITLATLWQARPLEMTMPLRFLLGGLTGFALAVPAGILQADAGLNRVLHNLCTDVWTYISLGYFAQVRGQGSVGSSTMPHKVNPIRFENAEANLEVSCALLDVLANTLVESRMQRDLTDSSMQRNIGTAFGHSLLAIDNVCRGLAGLDAVPERMAQDLDANWEVLAEPIQTVMRRYGVPHPYEQLKALTRGKTGITKASLHAFIDTLAIPAEARERLKALTPATYIGRAAQLARDV